jgi:CubicO group peptidase (beta-lactamase class C family)
MNKTIKGQGMRSILLVLMFYLPIAAVYAQSKKEDTPRPAQSIAELRQQLEKILGHSHTPGASVAIVHSGGPAWVAGLGRSNVAANQATTDETLFRVDSQAFVSLSILNLVNEGKLSLQDPVHNLVPEIWFENRWEATDPVRVVDLLEHTAGWDSLTLHEYAKDAKGMTLREWLDYCHHSRISRWRPGTRMAYCTSGPPVAAYIVEKITGQRFEDYVTQNFFLPIGMKTATYFKQPSPQLTTLYHSDGKTPYSYSNILSRPAGAINASAKDMATYVQFYLNRGAVGGRQITPATSIDRMETPTRSWEAREGLKAGYGLSSYTSVYNGFVYHCMDGNLTAIAYLSEYGVGYFYSINADDRSAFGKIGDAIRAYITRGLQPQVVPAVAQIPANAQEYAGWYEPASPQIQFFHFLDPLWLHRVRFEHGKLVFSRMVLGINQSFVSVSGEQYRYLPKEGPVDPIATAALITPNAEGRFIKNSEIWASILGGTWKRIPTWFVISEMVLTVWFLLAPVSILLYAPFWVLGGLVKKRRRPAERAMRVWPLIAALSLLTSLVLSVQTVNDAERLGNLTVWSLGLFLTTLIFGVASLASIVALWLARKQDIRRGVRWFSIAVTAALLIGATYFAYWGAIGIRTWE